MNLQAYFTENGIKAPTVWAKLKGLDPSLISRCLNGKGISPKNAAEIEKACDGQVTRMEILYPDQF
jgi:DNA-binding transcriptional regulator YdaS (Cro superfamily)